MHTTMIGAWHQERGVQQGCPRHEGGPRLIRFESPRWRSKETQVRVHLGVQEQPTPKSTPRPHTESVLDALYMDGKIISRIFQWNLFEAQIRSESTGIIETIEHPESARLPRHNLLGHSPVYRLGAHRGISRGVIHDLNLIYSVAATTLGLGFCLSLVFHGETKSFIVTVSISPFTVIQGPHS